MNQVVVVLLAVLWASILIPGLLRDRRQRSPQNSIDAFERSMGILANDLRSRMPGAFPEAAGGRTVLVVDDPERFARRPARLRTLRRRRQVLQALTSLTLVSAIAVAVAGAMALPALALSGTATGSYLLVLMQVRARESDERRTLRRLPARREHRSGHRVAAGEAVADSPA